MWPNFNRRNDAQKYRQINQSQKLKTRKRRIQPYRSHPGLKNKDDVKKKGRTS